MREKGFSAIILALIVGIVLVASYLLYTKNRQKETTPLPLPKESITSSEKKLGDPQISKEDGKIIFTDKINNYYLDLSSLPEVQLDEESDQGIIYQFDMYKKYNSIKGNIPTSVARFGFSQAFNNPNKLSLVEFAKQRSEYGYEPGRKEQGFWYGSPEVTSVAKNITLNDKYEAVNWTIESLGEQGFYRDMYFIKFGDKVVHIQMFTWDKKTFDSSKKDLRKVLDTFSAIDQK